MAYPRSELPIGKHPLYCCSYFVRSVRLCESLHLEDGHFLFKRRCYPVRCQGHECPVGVVAGPHVGGEADFAGGLHARCNGLPDGLIHPGDARPRDVFPGGNLVLGLKAGNKSLEPRILYYGVRFHVHCDHLAQTLRT